MGIVDAMEILDLISEVADRWDKMRKDWLRKHEITSTQFKVLVILQEKGSQTLGGLSDLLSCAPCNVTGIVDRLEAAGLVKRERSSTDRRVVNVVLSKKGAGVAEDLEKAALPELSKLGASVLGNLEDEDMRSLYDILPKLLGCFSEA